MQAKRPVSKGVRGTMGGAGGWGSLRDYFCCSHSEREREREEEEEEEEGTNVLISKRKRKKKRSPTQYFKKSFSLPGTKSTIDENPFFIDLICIYYISPSR